MPAFPRCVVRYCSRSVGVKMVKLQQRQEGGEADRNE